MVNIIENKSQIDGKIKSVHRDAGPPGFSQIEVLLNEAKDIADFPNLAKADKGSIITINVRNDQLKTLNIAPGNDLSTVVRKAFGQKYFIDSSADS